MLESSKSAPVTKIYFFVVLVSFLKIVILPNSEYKVKFLGCRYSRVYVRIGKAKLGQFD